MGKPKILYCEDQDRFRDEFLRRHSDQFDVETLGEAKKVLQTLQARRELPDIVLLDLYHPKITENYEEKKDYANRQLAELSEKVHLVKAAVDDAWIPDGVAVLQEVRKHYSARKLPIMIYSQRGLLLLEDELLQEVARNDAEWLIKDKERVSSTTEQIMIRDAIERRKSAFTRKQFFRILVPSIFVSLVSGVLLEILFSLSDRLLALF